MADSTLIQWLRKQARDGAHQPPSDHARLFTEAADTIERLERERDAALARGAAHTLDDAALTLEHMFANAWTRATKELDPRKFAVVLRREANRYRTGEKRVP